MCNLLPNYQVTPDCSETYEADSEFAYSENKDLESFKALRQKSKQNKESNPNTKSPLKTINYKSKLSQHNSIINLHLIRNLIISHQHHQKNQISIRNSHQVF
ncbi:unnamed protein product [Schistosoma mattheei]|uniref:Uncharacterized protein n=1 Tax=Schistosoma mattheei TaxID=31246 RepID=A0AA85BYZ2_9TREM|nr:unnamed protein product [Schistosoma mattheei]